MRTFRSGVCRLALAVGMGAATAGMASAGLAAPLIGLVEKSDSNPYFAKMREGAEAQAKQMGINLQTFAGQNQQDNDAQVSAIENLISEGAKGILLAPADPSAIVTTVRKAQAAGMLVVALDTPLNPMSAADMTYETDNLKAGQMIGKWAAATLGAGKTGSAKVAFLDGSSPPTSVDIARDQGFMQGFGIDAKDPKVLLDENDPRIVGHYYSLGTEEGGRTGMEQLLQKDPSTNVVFTVNEPAAAGAYQAIKAAGKANAGILIVSIDGGCPGVRNVKGGVIGATAQQYPLKMASLGLQAVVNYINSGKKPAPTPGDSFVDTGVQLVTDKPAPGIPSISSAEGLKICWG